MSNAKVNENPITILDTINQVDGFDPWLFAVEYSDLSSGDVRKRLPVMAQLAWFRLRYPEGKIIVNAKGYSSNDNSFFVGEAKVYAHYNDADNNCLAMATASRGKLQERPTISPREWAQTAALGIALRNAGFGLQFHAAGDSFDHNAINELEADLPVITGKNGGGYDPYQGLNEYMQGVAVPPQDSQDLLSAQSSPEGNAKDLQTSNMQPPAPQKPQIDPAEAAFQNACEIPCPINRFKSKKLGDLINMDPGTLSYIASNPDKFVPEVSAAAKTICEYALNVSSAS